MSWDGLIVCVGPDISYSNLLLDGLTFEENVLDLFNSNSPWTSPPSSVPNSPTLAASLSPLPSSASSLSHLPLEIPGLLLPGDQTPSNVSAPCNKDASSQSSHAKCQGHANRMRKRKAERALAKEARASVKDYRPRMNIHKNHVKGAEQVKTRFDTSSTSIASSGYVGVRGENSRTEYPLDQLVGPNSRFKFDYVAWSGETSLPITDGEERVVLVGGGTDPSSFKGVHEAAAMALENARPKLRRRKKDKDHRRGRFVARNVGISHDGGQTHPGTLRHSPPEAEVLESLRTNEAFVRLAGHQSAIFSTWAPRLHSYYADHLQDLLDHDNTLQRNFKNSVFGACAFNFGPRTVCYPHKDHKNLPFGWCAITSLGSFDSKKGGHLVLWDLRLVIEFPAGSTILVPSSVVEHSNTPIQLGETRYSFTQYSAGGTFRWVDHDFQKEAMFFAELSEEQQVAEKLKMSDRLSMGLSLLSKISEL